MHKKQKHDRLNKTSEVEQGHENVSIHYNVYDFSSWCSMWVSQQL